MPQAVVQGGSPVMMPPTYTNQMGPAKAPVMLMPVQTMQQMPGTSGNGLMYVQVPSGSTQENTLSQVPQVTIHPSGPQSSEDMQVRFILIKVCLQWLLSLLKVNRNKLACTWSLRWKTLSFHFQRLQLHEFKDARANCSCASWLRMQIYTPRHAWERALSNKINNDRTDGHCYSFAYI